MPFELTNVEYIIEREVKLGLNQTEVAQTYALALQSSYPTDWAKVNAAILSRWAPAGLRRIKEMAHRFAAEPLGGSK